jgi:hypothetical protein
MFGGSYVLKQIKVAVVAAIVLLALAVPSESTGQTTTGSVYGTVADPTGAVIPDASVTIKNTGTNESMVAKSNSAGAFVFPVVVPGTYSATAVKAGFATLTETDLRVSANQNVNASFAMKTGAVDSEVTVEASSTLIDTRESQIAETIDQKRIVDLPLAGRNAYDLVQLIPGVTNYSASSQIGDNTGTTFSVNGTRPNFNSFYLDGSYNTSFFRGGGNIAPAPDALSQFRIITSNFDAEFGRYPGAVVNTITRSGENQIHGVAYDYLRNRIFQAKNYFTQAGTAAPQYIYNVFGGGVGGHIIKDKLFYFVSYQGTRIRQQTTINPSAIVVPSDRERLGDFSQTTSVAKPALAVCPAYKCPLDAVTQNILKYVPRADPTQTVVNTAGAPIYHPSQQQLPNPISADQGTARIDYDLSDKHRFAFTYFNSQGIGFNRTAGGNQLLSYSGVSNYTGQSNYIFSHNWIVSSRAVNTATVSYTLNKTIAANVYNTGELSDLGATIRNGGAVVTQPMVTVTGYFIGGVGGSGPDTQAQLATGIEDTFNYTRGNHTVKAGGSMIFNKYQETASFLSSTKETFNGNAVLPGSVKSGNALADFIMGHAQSLQQNNGSLHRLHAWDPSLFVQDDWRLTRRLTANLGVRWEVYYPFSGQGNFGTFQAGAQSTRFPSAPKGLLLEGDPGVPAGVLDTSFTKFAPRVGFALDVFGNGKTSLRGAYGVFYSFSQETFVGNLEQQPFTLAVTLNNTTNLTNPYAAQTAFPGGSPFPYVVNLTNPTFTTGATFSGIPAGDSKIPYVQQYNLTLEQQYGDNWSTRISYIGNVGRHFYVARDQNAPIYSPTATTTNAPSRRPLFAQGYTSAVGLLDPSSNSSYNSLQLEATRRLKKGFSLQAFYVWSKAFDDSSSDPGSATTYTLSDQYNIQRDRGLSMLDVPQRFVASFLYQAPAVHYLGLIGREVLSGWQLNGIETLSTGSPFNVTSNVDSNFDTIATDRPNVAGNPFLGFGRAKLAKITQFFNTADYSVPLAGQPFGNSPRDPMVGPGNVETDVSAFKRFQIYGRANLLYRAELFNLFNNTNLNNPNGVLGNANFGRITSAGNARSVQMALKVEF